MGSTISKINGENRGWNSERCGLQGIGEVQMELLEKGKGWLFRSSK